MQADRTQVELGIAQSFLDAFPNAVITDLAVDSFKITDTESGYQYKCQISRINTKWPEPTVDQPDDEEIEVMCESGVADSTDGCAGIELDGTCQHGYPSWPMYLGLTN